MTAMRKKLIDKIVIDHKTDLLNHSYFMLLEIWRLNLQQKRPERKIQVVNIYDNWGERSYIQDGGIYYTRKALEDVNWRLVIQGQVLIAKDINAYSSV